MVAAAAAIGGLIGFVGARKGTGMSDKHPHSRLGRYVGVGSALGTAVGAVIGVLLDNVGVGVALGIGFGCAVGAAIAVAGGGGVD